MVFSASLVIVKLFSFDSGRVCQLRRVSSGVRHNWRAKCTANTQPTPGRTVVPFVAQGILGIVEYVLPILVMVLGDCSFVVFY